MIDSFWSLPQDKIFSQLQSGQNGLSSDIARTKLLEQNSRKKIKSRFQREAALFFNQFKSPLVLLLVAAVILSAFLGQESDAIIILFILMATGGLSYYQERNAGKAVEKLQSMITLKSTVIRDGKSQEIATSDIVPGDLITLKSGDIVPADCLVLESNEAYANEASLTGESYPVRKQTGPVDAAAPLSKRDNSLWQGSNIISGTAKAIVVNTGQDTIFGSIAKSMTVSTETAFEKGINKFGYFLMQVTIFFAVAILILLSVFLHKPLFDSVLFALALAIGMAPELLPAIMTIGMSAGAKRMLEKKVIVKKLSSIQNLGEINLLCTDKTGTITEGIIKIAGAIDAWKNDSPLVSKYAYLNAFFESGFSNPMDDALKAQKMDVSGYKKLGEVPYDFLRKRLSIAVTDDKGASMIISKGAVTNILDICTKTLDKDGNVTDLQPQIATIQKNYQEDSNQGYRVIGVCYKPITQNSISKEDEKDMILAGFILLEDPLKPGIEDAINQLKTLGIDIKIITGDNRYVAAHVAGNLKIDPSKILSGPEIQAMSFEALVVKAKDIKIFAEIEPMQKGAIIHALQKGGYTLAYMGDGINDVAAITAADAGISISNAVDVAREAADFVLLEKDLGVLADGVREGRRTFANTLKYIYINTGATFGNMFSVAIASLTLPWLPMLPMQILLTNFLTDFPYMGVSGDNVDEEQLEKPGKWNLKQIRSFMVVFGLHSSIFDVLTFVALYKILNVGEHLFQTGWFFESILTELCILFIIRTQKSIFKSVPGKNLIWLSLLSFILTLVLIYAPFGESLGLYAIPIKMLGTIAAIIFLYVVTADLLKVVFFILSNDKK